MSPVFSLLLAHTYFFISHSTSCAGQELSIANLLAQVTDLNDNQHALRTGHRLQKRSGCNRRPAPGKFLLFQTA